MAKTLASRLLERAVAAPKDFDPENMNSDSSSDSSDHDAAQSHLVEVSKSTLRTDRPYVDEVKYKGSRVSRNDLESPSSDESEVREHQFAPAPISQSEASSESDASESASEVEDSNWDSKRAELAHVLKEEQRHLTLQLTASAQADVERGEAIMAQTRVYEALLDARIVLQRMLNASNQLNWQVAADVGTQEALLDAIQKVHELRRTLSGESKPSSHKRTLVELAASTAEMDAALAQRRGAVLDRWARKVQLSQGSHALNKTTFKTLGQSPAVQVSSSLIAMDRLVKRTKVNRSQYRLAGVESIPEEHEGIFDDTDFYKELLKDFVAHRMADAGSVGLKWSVQKTKATEQKKAVDKYASKDRRLRFTVQDKIVGFDVPRNVLTWSDEQATELFSSLFGQNLTIDDNIPESAGEVELTGNFALFA